MVPVTSLPLSPNTHSEYHLYKGNWLLSYIFINLKTIYKTLGEISFELMTGNNGKASYGDF